MHVSDAEIQAALDAARECLTGQLGDGGFWEGRLSSSALSTAVASFALALAGDHEPAQRGAQWLAEHANDDGGWGDTVDSPSNLATTLLSWAAVVHAGVDGRRAEAWLESRLGSTSPSVLAEAVLAFYGNDRTFSAPILTMCALSNRLGDDGWRHVSQLPFELALVPRRFFSFLRLPVVSYALPALIAIGLARHRHAPSAVLPLRVLRDRCTPRVLRLLRHIQPKTGGFLEAAPLTGFVCMSLCASGYGAHPATAACREFLTSSQRRDGSWPIDTHLATWVTSLATRALCRGQGMPELQRDRVRGYLLATQQKEEHPFTQAAPGGWAWTHLPGGVPDADDTSAALIALKHLGACDETVRDAVSGGAAWLLALQNRDGGWPTFCRGWGRLPFDRSCADITAHVLRAFAEWHEASGERLQRRLESAVAKGVVFLTRMQRSDGAWLPLWFGNQLATEQRNPVYGTARVVEALRHVRAQGLWQVDAILEKGQAYLLASQNRDGGWGGAQGTPSSVEETALAVCALAGLADGDAAKRGAGWLIAATEGGTRFPPSPIGVYFAQLWYSEKLYPLVFTVDALGACSPLPTPHSPLPPQSHSTPPHGRTNAPAE